MKKKIFYNPTCRIFPIGQDRVISTSSSAPQRSGVSSEEYQIVSTAETDAWF